MSGQNRPHCTASSTVARATQIQPAIRVSFQRQFRIAVACLLTANIVAPALADNDDPLQVAPLDEITILDPRVDSEGKPTVLVQPGPYGEQQVDIPPTVIVHKYYYSGDREFQGPRFPGGPSIVVVNHPVSGDRLYVEAQMLPGAPRVKYRRTYIEYDFGERAVRIKFGHFLHLGHASRPKVSYRKGHDLTLDIAEKRKDASERTVSWVRRTGIPDATKATVRGLGGAIDATADGVRTVGEFVTSPAIQLINATPIGSLLSPSREEQAIRERDAAVRRAASENQRLTESIPTLR